MSLWISCKSGGELLALAMSASHDTVHAELEATLDRLGREGLRVRNILRGGEPAWDVLDPAGAVKATYWISRGAPDG
jgi:hypothetical protein